MTNNKTNSSEYKKIKGDAPMQILDLELRKIVLENKNVVA